MALGEFTKQLAQQAILSATAKDPPPAKELSSPANATGAAILAQVRAMQNALKEDEELALHFQNGAEAIRVLEIFLPTPHVAVLSGADQNGFARVIAPVESLVLSARVRKLQPGAKPHRIPLVTPKA